ncbi:ATP-binding cassette sub-family C member 4-like [Oppia nitens]|uniref:ATP-binding cassette sub-family C member 4-like n=1 Tax=Oppia nitens TaxID=1686743 RepID=UPI0023DC8549|nr:ATP-binding cassette sub-family C member 4-like [Oppia nitens]
MEVDSKIQAPSKWDKLNFLEKIFLTWVYPTFYTGWYKESLEYTDLFRCSDKDKALPVSTVLEKIWKIECKKKKPKFWWALIKTYGLKFAFPTIIFGIGECLVRIAQPLLLGFVIDYFSHVHDISYQEACLASGGIVFCSALYVSLHHPCLMRNMTIGMRLRTACTTLMYKKSLKLSQASLAKTTVGQIINIMSNDVNRFDEFSVTMTCMFVGPIQTVIVIIIIICTYLGVSSMVGLGLLILYIPFQLLMGKLFSRARQQTAKLTDSRLRLMNEIIAGMRVIKMYTWEQSFCDLVTKARKLEVNDIRKVCYLKAINLSLFFIAAKIILFGCFLTYVLLGHKLSPKEVFVTMALFNMLRITLTWIFPQSIAQGAELLVTCRRIQNFLELEEQGVKPLVNNDTNNSKKLVNKINLSSSFSAPNNNFYTNINGNGTSQLIVRNISAKWNQDIKKPSLDNISVNLKQGDLLAVIGPVGSGKSSFLMALLQELKLQSGSISINGTVSYSCQEPWSFNNSVRNNILFGCPYDERRYKDVVHYCALERDFKLFSFGDRTLVGEKGVSLSGGQKARITLARSLYRNTDICLMDDPLSAVDAAVAEHIFEKCIVNYLSNKIRVLVTHQIQFVRKATKILVLDDGKCLGFGTFDELLAMGLDFMSLLEKQEEAKDNNAGDKSSQLSAEKCIDNTVRQEQPSDNGSDGSAVTARAGSVRLKAKRSTKRERRDSQREIVDNDEEEEAPQVQDEQRIQGSIGAGVYWAYIKAGSGPILGFITILSTLVSQALFHASDLWLMKWSNNNAKESKNDSDLELIIYSALIAGLFVTTMIRSMTWFAICMIASKRLHNTIFIRLLRAPMTVFDSNPIGRILNRFTKDLGIIDEMLPATSFDLNLTVTQAIGILIVVAIAVNPYLIIPGVIMFALTIFARGIYIKTARDIKRMEGLTRSPVYSHVSTTLSGLASIRSYGAQQAFENQFYTYQDDHSATWFIFVGASRTLGLIADWLCVLYLAAVAAVIMVIHHDVNSGSAGLAFACALMLTGQTQFGVRQSAELESQMTSVERIIEYTQLPQESALESSEDRRPGQEWPDSGRLVLDKMHVYYDNAPDKPVLKNISCEIRGGEKVGIVGRTGAGKSSVISALFRMVEPTGQIIIDGVDTKQIGLHDLRRVIAIIPQDPVVFSGTMRRNLDPFQEFSDNQIWAALDEVQLRHVVQEMPGRLDGQLSEGGANFSVGQRQLVCLARAILRRNKILVLDEATANVDHQTDALIQQTIRNNFADCTVLTIAHRLNTIIDCDRVMVLDAGRLLEFDEPYVLLGKCGQFYDMCQKTGIDMYNYLQGMAREAYMKRVNRTSTL